MKKLSIIAIIAFISSAYAISPTGLTVEDSMGNTYDLGQDMEGNITIYGSGTSRYVRISRPVKISPDFEACINSDKNYSYTYRLKSNGTEHPDNMNFEQSAKCHQWNVTEEFLEEKLRVSIWARDSDGKFDHSNRSRSDYYVQVLYKNVSLMDDSGKDEKSPDKPSSSSILEVLIEWIENLINGD